MQLALSSFLAWFQGSQALERIIKMERRRHFYGGGGGGVVTEILYMIKRVRFSVKIIKNIIIIRRSLADRR